MYECKIAEKLSALRAAKGVTQDEAGQSLNVSGKTVSKWENGSSTPDIPMLVKLAEYYGVTTDAILGLSQEKKADTREEIRAAFRGLTRKESVFKAFETVKSIIPALYRTVSNEEDDVNDNADVFPPENTRCHRSEVSIHEFFEFVANSEDVNVAVMMLRNKANFAWMKDPAKQKEIARLFTFLSREDVLSVLYFIHSTACSENFTADYIAQNTGVREDRVREILTDFCAFGACRSLTAYLTEGEVTMYECFGDGLLLALITLAFEKMFGKRAYEYCFNGRCKMIGGK